MCVERGALCAPSNVGVNDSLIDSLLQGQCDLIAQNRVSCAARHIDGIWLSFDFQLEKAKVTQLGNI